MTYENWQTSTTRYGIKIDNKIKLERSDFYEEIITSGINKVQMHIKW